MPGGYRLSGRWPFSSGIDPSTWNMFGALVIDEELGQSEPRMFLLPACDYKIIDTWQVIGLAGTGAQPATVFRHRRGVKPQGRSEQVSAG